MEKILQRRTLVCKTRRARAVAGILAVVGAVALPQLFHFLGWLTGTGTVPGEVFLPMHIAIFLVGYFAGPWAGVSAGLVSPIVSFALTSLASSPMPGLVMLPYMCVELGVYGLMTGLLAKYTKLPVLGSLLLAQIAGRALRAIALVIGVYGFDFGPSLSVIWSSLLTGLPGLLLQWVLIPLTVFYVEKRAKDE